MIFRLFCLLAALSLTYANGTDDSTLFISAFNIQVFGKSKVSKDYVVEKLVQIIKRYDMTVVQEIRDIDEVAFPQLVDAVNAASDIKYSSFMSPRSGRTSSKEQYGYIYNPEKLQVLSQFEFPDDREDIFEREPYIVKFADLRNNAAQSQFNTIVLHAKPDDAVSEVSALADAYDYAVAATGETNAIIMGDLNADCSYITSSEWSQVKLCTESRFSWMIPNSADTTVSSTDCAYDRIVTAGDITPFVIDAAVFDFETEYRMTNSEAKEVSDHFPVEFYVSLT